MLFRKPLKATQDNIDEGFLQIQAVSDNNQMPVSDATIEIANTGEPNFAGTRNG